MSIAAVAHRYAFGLKGDVKNNVLFVDDNTVLFPAGSNVIMYNIETKLQKFLTVVEDSDGITAMALSSNNRLLIIAEKADKPTVSIWDLQTLRKKRTLIMSDSQSKEIVSVAMSNDTKYLIVQTAAPDWTLSYWAWEKGKMMGSTKSTTITTSTLGIGNNGPEYVVRDSMAIPGRERRESISDLYNNNNNSNSKTAGSKDIAARSIDNNGNKDGIKEVPVGTVYQVSFHPSDPTLVSLVGNGVFRLFRYSEGTIKVVGGQKIEAKNFLCQTWIADDRLVLGTEDGKLFIVQSNGDIVYDLINAHGVNNTTRAVSSLIRHTKGFVAGGSGGSIVLYERIEDPLAVTKEYFRKMKDLALPEESARVCNLTMTSSEEWIVLSTHNQQIYTMAVNGGEARNSEENKGDIVCLPFHHGQITGLDTCIRKPLVVTCGTDKSIRIWNYVDNTSELVRYFVEEPNCVSIHPSGLYVLVGFNDKVKLMNLLIDDLRTFKEFPIRGCRECKFSNGGQYFAAVNGNIIQIFSTWNFENLVNLKGHSGRVRSLTWMADDTRLVSCGIDGAIYSWSITDLMEPNQNGYRRDGETITKACTYTSVVALPDGSAVYAVGTDKMFKELRDNQIAREVPSVVALTQLCISNSGNMLFAGTADGKIQSIKFPLDESSFDFQQHASHSSPVTRLRISFDDQYLFSTAEDGSMYVFRVTEKENKLVGTKRDRTEPVFADEILVTQSDLEDKNQLMFELKTRVEELKMENEYQLRLKDMNFAEKIKEVTEKFMQEIESLKITSAVLRTEKEKEEVRFEEEVNEEKDSHSRALLELETSHSAKLMIEYEKYQELQNRTNMLQHQWEGQVKSMKASQEKALIDLTNHFEAKLEEKRIELQEIQQEIQKKLREHEEITKESEEDADTEILELKHRYEKKLKEEKEVGIRLKGENGIMRKKFNALQNEIDAQKAEISKMIAEEKKLNTLIKSLEKDIVSLKKEIQERDETIQDKEKRIYDLKKKNQELEKFKFVLDYKIKELKRQIEPREQDIQGMTKQIKEMDTELQHYNSSNNNLDLAISDLRLKLKASDMEIKKEREMVHKCAAVVRKFKIDLNECIKHIQDPATLKKQLKTVYQKYCLQTESANATHKSAAEAQLAAISGPAVLDELEMDVQAELARQRNYMEEKVSSLRQKIAKDQLHHRQDSIRVMNENVTLIKEINQLRRDLKTTKAKELADRQPSGPQKTSHTTTLPAIVQPTNSNAQ